MTPFAGTPLFFEPVVLDADIAVPDGTMFGIAVASAGTVRVIQRDGQPRVFTTTGADNLQGDFKRVTSTGTSVPQADLSVARR